MFDREFLNSVPSLLIISLPWQHYKTSNMVFYHEKSGWLRLEGTSKGHLVPMVLNLHHLDDPLLDFPVALYLASSLIWNSFSKWNFIFNFLEPGTLTSFFFLIVLEFCKKQPPNFWALELFNCFFIMKTAWYENWSRVLPSGDGILNCVDFS